MRPRKFRRICFEPGVRFFKPQGISMKELDVVELNAEELEALRLKNHEELDQNSAALRMRTSQSTYQRILASAYRKVTDALVNGKAIKISEIKPREKKNG